MDTENSSCYLFSLSFSARDTSYASIWCALIWVAYYFWGSHSDSGWNFVTLSGSSLIIIVCTNYNNMHINVVVSHYQGLIVSWRW